MSERRGGTKPALGLLWSNCVNERLGLKKRTGGVVGPTGDNIKRHVTIEKSSYLRRGELEIEVHDGGVRAKD